MRALAPFAFTILLTTFVCLSPLSVAAQTPSGGPMIIERIHSGFLAAPDIKVTEMDHRVLPIVGGYAGWNTDDTFFIGAGGYWLANDRHNDREMAYGGLVAQWLGNRGGRFSYGIKGLVGGGEATKTETFTVAIPLVRAPNGQVLSQATTRTDRVRFRRGFALAEPELLGAIRLSKHLRLTGGVGYRFAGTDSHRDPFGGDFRLNGATGSVALQIGGGS